MDSVFIRAEVLGENAAGQKHIHLLANNADGIHFWTDDKSIIRSIEPEPHWIPCCERLPDTASGQMARYNCPFWVKDGDRQETVRKTMEGGFGDEGE